VVLAGLVLTGASLPARTTSSLTGLVLTGTSYPVRPPLPAPAGSGRVAGAVCGTSVLKAIQTVHPNERNCCFVLLAGAAAVLAPMLEPVQLALRARPGTSFPVRTTNGVSGTSPPGDCVARPGRHDSPVLQLNRAPTSQQHSVRLSTSSPIQWGAGPVGGTVPSLTL